MRRTQNVPKRIAVAILAASMAMTPVTASVTCPMVAFAEVVADNPDGETIENVDADDTMNQNNGTVTNNFGTVQENNDTVTNNFGTVQENNGTVTNNYAGTVNDGDGNGTVTNQFYTVSVSFSNTSSSYGEGFTYSPNSNDTNHYIKVTSNGEHIESSGAITIAPSEGYQLGGENSANNNLGYSYTLERNGKNYVLTIINPEMSISIVDPQTIGLVVQAIQQANPDPRPYVFDPPGPELPEPISIDKIMEALGSIPQTAVNINSIAANTEVAPVAPVSVGVSSAQISAMIESALAVNPSATVLDIDLGNEPSLTVDSLIALSEKNNIEKRCYFTHNGMKYVLFIPAIDPTSASYQQCKALFDAEPGKQAGPIRLAQLFAPVGFKWSQE